MKPTDRRSFIKNTAGVAGMAVLLNPLSKALGAACGITPPQTPGPFYPGESQFHSDNDLTILPGHSERADGQVVYIKGKVIDQNCSPLQDTNVEIWQACSSGRYNNTRDPNSAPLDPHFKYWAETFTDNLGEYWFKTIIPGEYPADTNWMRPPHIHFKITKHGYRELITQMYFKGNQFNDTDLILREIPEGERDSVIVEFTSSPADLEPGSLIGIFDITLRSVRV